MELLLGCGAKRDKRIQSDKPWKDLVTLDINPDHKPDYIFDLSKIGELAFPNRETVYRGANFIQGLPFENDKFYEIHAYEVLEHIGQQGDYKKFFAQFSDFWRILKPGGLICATVPSWNNMWAFGDPSHTRVINEGTLIFLSQQEYKNQVGITAMSDFRYIYKADFDIRMSYHRDGTFYFILEAIKPSRYYAET